MMTQAIVIFHLIIDIYKSNIIKFISSMNNPEVGGSCNLSPRSMYSYDRHTNQPWNITQYQVPVLHYDYMKIRRDREYASQKKGVKVNDFYVTKRGFYMDYDLKVAKGIPSSAEHQQQKPWDDTQHKLQGELLKTARESIKYTIYDRIEMKQKKDPVPSVSTYRLEKSLEDIQKLLDKNKSKKIKQGQKRYFHMDTSFLSDKVPGSGHYNPHEEVEKLHKSVGDWKFWTKKHEKWGKVLQKRELKIPAPGTYTPIDQSYKSFASIQKKEKKQIKNGFGSDARFPYLRSNKKVIIEKRPSPDAYQTKIDWKGKNVSPNKKEWVKMIWKGSPDKVYT